MRPLTLQGIALVLMLVPTAFISVAYAQDLTALAVVGVAMVVLGGLVPPVLRYAGPDEDNDSHDQDDAPADDHPGEENR